jgi:PKD repeat protein
MVLPGAVSALSSVNAQFINDTIPATMNAGQSYFVSVTMKNTGSMTWTETDTIRLGTVNDASGDAYKFGPSRIKIPAGTSVRPGAQYTFSFNMTAPATAGTFAPVYRMVWDGHTWFGARAFQFVQVVGQAATAQGVPVAQFTASPLQGQSPLTVQFTDQSVSTGTTSYAWDVNNDGKTEYTTKNPVQTYSAAGTYAVNLTVTNASGKDNEIKTGYIIVSPAVASGTPPKAQFTSNVTRGTSPLIVQFTDQSTGSAPLTYHWDFSDGAGNLPENSQQNPVWRFWEDAGTSYTVTMTVTNAYGSDTIVKQNAIGFGAASSAPPVAAFTSNVQSGTAPLTVQFTDQSTGTSPLTYAWDFTNDKSAESTVKSPSYTFTTAGSYTVNLTVVGANGKDSEIKTNYIAVSPPVTIPPATPTPAPVVGAPPLPVAAFTSSVQSGTAPLTVQFTDQSTGTSPLTYSWDFTNDKSAESTVKSPSYTFTTAGTYTVNLTVVGSNGKDSEIKTNYITVSPPVTIPTATPTPAPTLSSVNPDSSYGTSGYTGAGPIGGGEGYGDIKTTGDYTVTTLAQFRSHMVGGSQPATTGQVIFIPSGTTITFPAGNTPAIPAGVTLASDRGYDGHAGAVLKKSASSGGWTDRMLDIGGNNVRITGLQLEGEMFPSTSSPVVSEGNYLEGIKNYGGYTGEIVDNNELRGWAYSAVEVKGVPTAGRPWIHNNYFHHNQARGEGYGIEVYGGDALVEANIFNYNRHDITSTGVPGEKYEFRFNLIQGGCDNPIGGVHVDVHESLVTSSPGAGNTFLIHHNTVIQGSGTSQQAFVHIRDIPQTGAYIYNNDIQTNWGSGTNYDGAQTVIYQSHSQTKTVSKWNLFATNNKWKGTVYATNSGIVWTQCGSGSIC